MISPSAVDVAGTFHSGFLRNPWHLISDDPTEPTNFESLQTIRRACHDLYQGQYSVILPRMVMSTVPFEAEFTPIGERGWAFLNIGAKNFNIRVIEGLLDLNNSFEPLRPLTDTLTLNSIRPETQKSFNRSMYYLGRKMTEYRLIPGYYLPKLDFAS